MRRDEQTSNDGYQLYKSDIKTLVDQIHEQLVCKPRGAQAPAELLDFLSSVCVTEERGHEKIQTCAPALPLRAAPEEVRVDPGKVGAVHLVELVQQVSAQRAPLCAHTRPPPSELAAARRAF